MLQLFQYFLDCLFNCQLTVLNLYQNQLLQHMSHPITRWAQRKDRVFVEIHLMDITNQRVQLTQTHLKFEGESAGKKYALDLELFAEVDSENSKWNKTGFHLLVVLQKKDVNAPFWPRLLKSKDKNQYIQVDWSKWVDEDQQEEDPNKGLGGFDPSQMQNFGGMGGGFGQSDQDDEQGNLDDLQKEEQLEGAKQKKQEQKA